MDTLGDLLTRIRNAVMAGKKQVEAPRSRPGEAVCRILVKTGYLKSVTTRKDGSSVRRGGSKQWLVLEIAYGKDGKPTVNHIQRVSKPGRRVYVTSGRLPRVLRGYGAAIISTPKGIMTDGEARKARVGGEVICEIW